MGVEANVKIVRDLLSRDLVIPAYQRPYRWTGENVMQLLRDVLESLESGKQEYRIGTIILYKTDDDYYEIVDGQQRLTTILLVLLGDGVCNECKAVGNLRYQSNSFANIRDNFGVVKNWLRDNAGDNDKFAQYLVSQCTVVEIVVNDLSEAFQMFDTQNGRGKSLEPYNLLKAYHIRAMDQNSEEEKIQCDRDWENAAQYGATPDIQNDPNEDILSQLFNEQLFKSRVWCRNEEARCFSKDDIGEFKGFTIDKNHPVCFPFQNPYLLQYLTEKFYRNVLAGTIGTQSRLSGGDSEKANPFVNINQTIINGKSFFEYIQTYVELYKKLFIELGSYQLADFKQFFYFNCLVYDTVNIDEWSKIRNQTDLFRKRTSETNRTGDKYLREVYKSLCFVMLDKFGEEIFRKYYRKLYRIVYKIRLQNYSVRFKTAMSMPTKYFSVVQRAKGRSDLLILDKLANDIKDETFAYSKKIDCDDLVRFIEKGE